MRTAISKIVTVFIIAAAGLMLLGSRCFYEPKERVNPLDPRNIYSNSRPQIEAILIDTMVDTGLTKMVRLNWALIDHWHVTGYNLFRYMRVETGDTTDTISDSAFVFRCITSKAPDETAFTDTLADPIWRHFYFMTAILDGGVDSLVSDTVRNPSILEIEE